MFAVYKKEMRGYFRSLLGYLFLAFYFLFLGIYVYVYNLDGEYANFAYAVNGVARFFVLLIPMLTMRVFAEERRQKTDQLLFTSPVSIPKIVIGKYLALASVMAIASVGTCIYPLILKRFGETNLSISYSTIAAFFLLGCAYMGIGMFVSALTESQVVAAVLTFIVILFTWVVDLVSEIVPTDAVTAVVIWLVIGVLLGIFLYRMMKSLPAAAIGFVVYAGAVLGIFFANRELLDGSVGKVCGFFSLLTRFEPFMYGIFTPSVFVYYLSMIVLFVFLTVEVLWKRRWSE